MLEVPVSSLGGAVAVRTWAPSSTPEDEPLPLLLVHDGPDYDALASLTQYLGAGIAGGWLPRLRAALLSATDRNSWYSASARYARALTEQVIPAVTGIVATTAGVGMGTSLGALAMLHAHCRRPGTFSGLFLQSGSFLYRAWIRRNGASATTAGSPRSPRPWKLTACRASPFPSVMTCGSIEENIANNRLMLTVLRSAGYQATPA